MHGENVASRQQYHVIYATMDLCGILGCSSVARHKINRGDDRKKIDFLYKVTKI